MVRIYNANNWLSLKERKTSSKVNEGEDMYKIKLTREDESKLGQFRVYFLFTPNTHFITL